MTHEEIQRRIESLASGYLKSGGNVGLAVAVVAGDATETFGFGKTAAEGETVGPDTLFEIGSITKVFTTTLLAEMSLRGEVGLNDPVRKYLPDEVKLPGRAAEITLWQLATHTSGLPRLPGNLKGPGFSQENPYAHYTVDDLYAALAKIRLKRRPGTCSEYSNLGMGLLGLALARAAGTDYETLVRERVCLPLGMTDTATALSETQAARLARGHARGKPVSGWDLPALPGAGALRSSARDMAKFLRANVDPAGSPLKDAFELAQTMQFGRGEGGRLLASGLLLLSVVVLWTAASLLLRRLAPGLPDGARLLLIAALAWYAVGWLQAELQGRLAPLGLGWHTMPLKGRQTALWHNGGTGGYASFLGFVRARRTGVVILSNSNNSVDSLAARMLDALLG